jgi:hypothetical protein
MKEVLTDAFVEVNGVNISSHCSSVTVADGAEEVDVTGFGSGYHEVIPGLKTASITLNVFQDYDNGSVFQTLNPLYESGGTFGVKVRGDSGAKSGTNPEYQMTGRLFNRPALAGAVGEANTTEITVNNGGTAGLTVGTA